MLKLISVMKLGQKFSASQFVIAQIFILIFGLIFLGGLYYILNLQYSKPATLFLNGPVTTAPKSLRLDLDQPDDDILVYTEQITVTGKAGAAKTILISTDTTDQVIEAQPNGTFTATLDLDEGVNRIKVTAFDTTGDSRSEERTVYYSKEKI